MCHSEGRRRVPLEQGTVHRLALLGLGRVGHGLGEVELDLARRVGDGRVHAEDAGPVGVERPLGRLIELHVRAAGGAEVDDRGRDVAGHQVLHVDVRVVARRGVDDAEAAGHDVPLEAGDLGRVGEQGGHGQDRERAVGDDAEELVAVDEGVLHAGLEARVDVDPALLRVGDLDADVGVVRRQGQVAGVREVDAGQVQDAQRLDGDGRLDGVLVGGGGVVAGGGGVGVRHWSSPSSRSDPSAPSRRTLMPSLNQPLGRRGFAAFLL